MYRNSIGLFVFALALFGRLVLPMAAPVHVADFWADALAGAPICAHDGVVSMPDAPSGHDAHDCENCSTVCCHALGVLLAAPPVVVALANLWIKADWRALAAQTPALLRVAAHRARGPPSIS
jgi:hypothetical protein